MKISNLAPAIFGLIVMCYSVEAQAHPCSGIKSAHCSCTATLGLGGALLASRTNHGACYNQQTNVLPTSNCASYCSTQLGYLQSAADSALAAAKICGSQTIVMKFSAGTNLPTPWNSQARFGCVTSTGPSGGTGAGTGTGPNVGSHSEPVRARGAPAQGDK